VVAASTVITQWETCIRTFAPHLRTQTISDVHSLKKFNAVFRPPGPHSRRALDKFDIILLKAGTVTTSFLLEGEPAAAKHTRSLTQALYMVTEGYVWARMIIDDFDTLKLTHSDRFLPALFTWVISATCRRSRGCKREITASPTVETFIRNNSAVPIMCVASDELFDNILKLHCDPRFVRKHINTTTVKYRRIVLENGRAMKILDALGVPEDVLEMVAAGAIETAAVRLNIKIDSVGGLFRRILATHRDKYARAITVTARVVRARQVAASARLPQNTHKEVSQLRRALKRGTGAEVEAALATLGMPSQAFFQAMDKLEEWASKEREEHGCRLQRMRENIRQETCQACQVPFDGERTYIVNCCQILLCQICTTRTKTGFITRCPNCAGDVDPSRDLIYIGSSVELTQALTDETFITETNDDIWDAEPSDGTLKYDAWRDPRLRTLLQLVCGDPIQCLSDTFVRPIAQKLLAGRREIPFPEKTPHRYLIFTMETESTRLIDAAFKAVGVDCVRLKGSRQNRDAAVARFKSGGVNVMLAASSMECAGLHLPEVTRLVLYHHHVSPDVAQQAIGRAQRVGREYSLEVIELVTEWEVNHFRLEEAPGAATATGGSGD
jgi:hypothetical protein